MVFYRLTIKIFINLIYCHHKYAKQRRKLTQFAPTHFDYIIIDETHRAGASSYLKILNYFQPQFLLGMTATPERTDGFDIYQLFDHNIAYEISFKSSYARKFTLPISLLWHH